MSGKRALAADGAPPATGTYSQAIRVGDLLFLTGQTGRDPETGRLADGLSAQTRRLLANVEATLAAAGSGPGEIVKVTLLMANIRYFKRFDDLYRAWLPPREEAPYPARTALEAAALPAGALVMLDVVAAVPPGG